MILTQTPEFLENWLRLGKSRRGASSHQNFCSHCPSTTPQRARLRSGRRISSLSGVRMCSSSERSRSAPCQAKVLPIKSSGISSRQNQDALL